MHEQPEATEREHEQAPDRQEEDDAMRHVADDNPEELPRQDEQSEDE